MRKKTLDLPAEDEVAHLSGKEGSKRFFACYLLASLSPRYKGHSYIGFTVNPRRRIRQHNGEITSGAWRTKSKRPWEMVLCIYGFPTNVSALQFEWAWQHPRESLAVREAAAALRSFSGVANKIKLAYTMLNLPSWQTLPEHMKVQVCSIDELPCFMQADNSPSGNEHDLDEEEEDHSDHISQSEEVNTTDASDSNNSQSDLLMVGEICNKEVEWLEEPETVVDDRIAKITSFCIEETAEDANMLASIPRDTAEAETQAGKANGLDVGGGGQRHGFMENEAKNSTATTGDLSKEVEVIDLVTPSPCCRVGSLGKKQRVPDIIDLTRSPNFIQL